MYVYACHQLCYPVCGWVKGHKHIRIDGKTAPEIRQSLCDEFQHDQECLVAVLSITTANAGVRTTPFNTLNDSSIPS